MALERGTDYANILRKPINSITENIRHEHQHATDDRRLGDQQEQPPEQVVLLQLQHIVDEHLDHVLVLEERATCRAHRYAVNGRCTN